MHLILSMATLVLSAVVAWQDFKSRLIAWWLPPLLFAAGVVSGLQQVRLRTLVFYTGINLLFVAFLFVMLFLWFSMRKKQWTNIFREAIGTGDLLFMVSMAAFFSVINFIVALSAGFIVALVLHLPAALIKNTSGNAKTIPLAGVLALELIALLVWQLIDPAIHFYSDHYWFSLLN